MLLDLLMAVGHLILLGNLDLNPQAVVRVVTDLEDELLAVVFVGLVQVGLHLLPQVVFVIHENLFGWFRAEIPEAHGEHHEDAQEEKSFNDVDRSRPVEIV